MGMFSKESRVAPWSRDSWPVLNSQQLFSPRLQRREETQAEALELVDGLCVGNKVLLTGHLTLGPTIFPSKGSL